MGMLASQQILFDIKHHHSHAITLDELKKALENDHAIIWIHCDLNNMAHFNEISHMLGLSDNVIDIIKESSAMPQLDDTMDSLTMRMQCIQTFHPGKNGKDAFESLSVHLTKNYCLTVSYKTIPALKTLQENYVRGIKYAKTPCFILFLLLDNIINDYAKMLFEYEVKGDEMDFKVRATHKNLYPKVMTFKKEVMHIKRYAGAIRDLLMRTSGKKLPVISPECQKSLGDLFNHSQVIVNEAESIRELLNGLLDQIDNTLIHKLNETMRVLTAFAAVFLPLTLIAGIYGMNFHWMPELSWKYGYFYALGLMTVCGGLLLFTFKRMRWF